MSARAEWEYLAQCDECGRRTSFDVPDRSPCILPFCFGRMLRRDVPRGDETEFPIRGVASTGDRHA